MRSKMVAAMAETAAEVTGLPCNIPAALVLNSGSVDLVVDNAPVSLNPQSGCRADD
jgi:hypothetical protein